MTKKELEQIIKDDYASLQMGNLSSDPAYKLHTLFRILYQHDKGKVKKSIENFYVQLKKQYPELAEWLRTWPDS